MSEQFTAWQCIGCGRIEAPETCIGICQDRKVELVYAFEHQKALEQLTEARLERERLVALLRRLAFTTPRNDDWKGAFLKFQEEARSRLAEMRGDAVRTSSAAIDGR